MSSSTGGWSAAVPSIRAIPHDTLQPDWKVSVLQPARFNTKGRPSKKQRRDIRKCKERDDG